MHTTAQLLNALSSKLGGVTDYRIAKTLNTSTSVITSYRKGKRVAGAEIAIELAQQLGWPHAYVVACVEHERAQRSAYERRMPPERAEKLVAVWQAIGKTFKGIAPSILLLALFGVVLGAVPREAQAAQVSRPFARSATFPAVRMLYIM